MHVSTATKLVLLCVIALPAGCASSSRSTSAGHPPMVRVQVLAGQEQVVVGATAPPAMQSSGESGWRRVNFPAGGGIPVTLSPGGWRVGNLSFPSGELTIQPSPIGSVSVNGTAYRGRYRFVPVAAGRFDVVNDVEIDAYLMSVVSKEVLPDWHIEAFKAQAIAARTYALYESSTSSNAKHFDVFADVRSQVYGGMNAESPKSQQAVSDTAGVVVVWGPRGSEKIFKTYFSSCCGGSGQSAHEAFGDPAIAPLAAKRPGQLCAAATYYNWPPVVLAKSELTRRIRSWGAGKNHPIKDIGMIASIDIAQLNNTGRPIRFVLTDVAGRRYSLAGEDFRWACNADANGGPTLRSTLLQPVTSGDSIQFTQGRGWGHGVGMCQWCAQSLALQGRRHEQIVRFSYPGAVLVRAY